MEYGRLQIFMLVLFSSIVYRSIAQTLTYTPVYTDANFEQAINVNLPVGVVAGTHAVTSSGGASYSIPIKLPPGTNGTAPTLALQYTSQAGSGICGMALPVMNTSPTSGSLI